MNVRDLAAGDRVRIREWDDMLCEFGGDDNRILCRFSFTSSMRKWCGQELIIDSIHDDAIFLQEEGGRVITNYKFSVDMLESNTSAEIHEFSDDSFIEILSFSPIQ